VKKHDFTPKNHIFPNFRGAPPLDPPLPTPTPYIYTYIIVIKMSNAVGCGFDHRSGQTKDYEIDICSFSTKYVALRRKSKDWLARNQDIVS
jgi:hypothetical protein